MKRLLVVVEGQTEEAFVNGVLAPYLLSRGVVAKVTIVVTKRNKAGPNHKGGGRWAHWQNHLKRVLASDTGAMVTTMFDLYHLPTDFPFTEPVPESVTGVSKARLAEDGMRAELARAGLETRRFLPYVQVHEYEALVLASLDHLEKILDHPAELEGLAALRREIGSTPPEDGPTTAPSKRIERHIPSYQKVVQGELAVGGATLAALVRACPHFGAWVEQLAQLGSADQAPP